MKKYKFYVCSRYVFYFCASLLAVILMWVILMLFSKNVKIMIYCFITVSIISVHYFFLARGSFSKVYITEEGIGNKYLFFAWAEIASYHLCEIEHPLGLTFPTQFFPMIVCIGDVSSNVFFHCSSKKAVCFSLTKKNLKMIDEMCEEKNETMKELLSWSNFPIKKW